MLRIIFTFVFLLIVACFNAQGQYHLGEIGLAGGGGAALAIEPSAVGPGTGLNGNFFYSHWACGKRYGYHGSLGYAVLNYNQKGSNEFLPIFNSILPKGKIRTSYIHAGFYFKIRKNEFVRRQETSYLIGAKFNLLTQAQTRINGSFVTLNSNTNQKITFFVPTIHISAWFKRRLDKQSFYFAPGIDFMVLPLLSGLTENLISFYPHLNLGYTIWNSKQPKFKK